MDDAKVLDELEAMRRTAAFNLQLWENDTTERGEQARKQFTDKSAVLDRAIECVRLQGGR